MLCILTTQRHLIQFPIFAIFDNNVWFGVRERVWSVSWLCATGKEPHNTSNTHFLDENGHITNDWWHTIEARWTMHGNMYQPFVQYQYMYLIVAVPIDCFVFCFVYHRTSDTVSHHKKLARVVV